jgi:hypothetical protein
MKIHARGLRVEDPLRLFDLPFIAKRDPARKGSRYRDALDLFNPEPFRYEKSRLIEVGNVFERHGRLLIVRRPGLLRPSVMPVPVVYLRSSMTRSPRCCGARSSGQTAKKDPEKRAFLGLENRLF